jgi:hypothetical protein
MDVAGLDHFQGSRLWVKISRDWIHILWQMTLFSPFNVTDHTLSGLWFEMIKSLTSDHFVIR